MGPSDKSAEHSRTTSYNELSISWPPPSQTARTRYTHGMPRTLVTSNVSVLKALLPAASYIHLLHQGVMTGFLPRFSPEGKPTGQFDNLAPRDRMDLARYLIDKVVPDAPKELALVSATPTDPESLTAQVIAGLPTDELRRLANPTQEVAPPDVTTPLDAVPACQR